ncbi:LysR family transcriptional regulator [Shewanella intestini]|uniref:LysR family transcriptional regulator n=1 Tax=Shewanella intestini TaxID=2017544 RepID=A0ABS5I4T8_9GAMM|nr:MULTISPECIES: LysR family transcriptional regulator [Shewanella]MBR9729034.1 LysR family transcriptional regulator [Shewanella intestini]MRG36900.1 LysR family transcriptional regulator [Shewanella sp. XMDDZSB0408]
MDVSFEQLKSMVVFAQVIEQGNFSQAAKKMGLSRAVVSYHIKKLETQLEVKLLNRSTRSIHFTEAGKAYYQACKVISEQASLANQQMLNMKNEPEGLIKLSCPVNAGLQTIVPALNEFKNLYPKISLDVSLTDEVVHVINQGIDLAIRGAPLVDSGLHATKLCQLTTCLCGSARYFEQHGRPTTPTELGQHQWVIYQPQPKILTLAKGTRSYSIELSGSVSTNNAAARTAFVEGGHGIGRIPTYDAWPKIQQGSLEAILTDYQLKDITIYGVFPPGAAKSKRVRLLIDFLKAYFVQQTNQLSPKIR